MRERENAMQTIRLFLLFIFLIPMVIGIDLMLSPREYVVPEQMGQQNTTQVTFIGFCGWLIGGLFAIVMARAIVRGRSTPVRKEKQTPAQAPAGVLAVSYPTPSVSRRATTDSQSRVQEPSSTGRELRIEKYPNRISSGEVKHVGVRNKRWDIVVNQYNDKRSDLVQVFIVDLQSDNDWHDNIPLSQVDRYIADKTGMSENEVRALYAKG